MRGLTQTFLAKRKGAAIAEKDMLCILLHCSFGFSPAYAALCIRASIGACDSVLGALPYCFTQRPPRGSNAKVLGASGYQM